ncbi:hypothetical protein LIER_29721 [Lithospermum erythrorhizon]|uniref:DUF4283 domain-containing protein n=1 Tax=Lithospermum erythrorhizon TaxID=34254 RepID=A0AAV3RLM8_LITER
MLSNKKTLNPLEKPIIESQPNPSVAAAVATDQNLNLKPTRSYVEVAKSRNPNRLKLSFIPPEVVDGKAVVKYKSAYVLPSINRWNLGPFAYVMGLNPSSATMENFAKNQWKEFNFEEIFLLTSRVFLFRFKSDEDKDNMLANGPWLCARRPMILKA